MYVPGFVAFLRERIGSNWVLARRSPRIVYQYGDDVICLSLREYKRYEAHCRRLNLIEKWQNRE